MRFRLTALRGDFQDLTPWHVLSWEAESCLNRIRFRAPSHIEVAELSSSDTSSPSPTTQASTTPRHMFYEQSRHPPELVYMGVSNKDFIAVNVSRSTPQ